MDLFHLDTSFYHKFFLYSHFPPKTTYQAPEHRHERRQLLPHRLWLHEEEKRPSTRFQATLPDVEHQDRKQLQAKNCSPGLHRTLCPPRTLQETPSNQTGKQARIFPPTIRCILPRNHLPPRRYRPYHATTQPQKNLARPKAVPRVLRNLARPTNLRPKNFHPTQTNDHSQTH